MTTTSNRTANLQAKAGLKDRNGELNLVARVRRTRKGQKLTVKGTEVGGPGKDGSDYYVVREAAEGRQGPMRLYCSCPAQRFHAGYGKACKHVAKLLAEAGEILAAGEFEAEKRDFIVVDAEAIARAQLAVVAAGSSGYGAEVAKVRQDAARTVEFLAKKAAAL